MTVWCAVILFTSCSNNDEPSTPSIGLQELAGNYRGNLDVTLVGGEDGEPTTVKGQMVTVIANGESAIDLKISDFAFGPMQLGNIELTNCPVKNEGERYTFTGTTSLSLNGLTADVDAVGSIVNGTLKIDRVSSLTFPI